MSPGIFINEEVVAVEELSIFIDESGDTGNSRYYLVTLVFHEQSHDLGVALDRYDRLVHDKRLADLPMHLGPLLTGHKEYEGLSAGTRKSYLSCFAMLAERIPFGYITLSYEKKLYAESPDKLLAAMKRDLVMALFDNLSYLQRFDKVKVYYDNGQSIVTDAVHKAVRYVLWKDVVVYRLVTPADYRLFQLADYICTLELTALKYQAHAETATDRMFFGQWGSFKKNYFKKLRRHRLG